MTFDIQHTATNDKNRVLANAGTLNLYWDCSVTL